MEKTQVETTEVTPEVRAEEVEVVEEVAPKKSLDEVLDMTNDTMDKLQQDLERRELELFQREVKSSLKDAGLEAFEEVINVENHKDLETVMTKLTKIMNDMKIENSYQPTDNAKQDAYSIHTKNKDTKNMIGSKLANLFK